MSLLDQITQHLDPATIGTIAGKLGIDPEKAKSAVASALPTIVGALAKNTKSDDGSAALNKALDKHDGSILDKIQGAAPAVLEQGQKILSHIFGSKQNAAASGVAQHSGLPLDEVNRLLASVAPGVMGVIGQKKTEGVDVTQALQADADKAKAQSNGLLAALDADGDGDIMDDIAKQGGNVLGAMFGGKK